MKIRIALFSLACGIMLTLIAISSMFSVVPNAWVCGVLTIVAMAIGGVITGVAIICRTPSFVVSIIKTVIILAILDGLFVLALNFRVPTFLADVLGITWYDDSIGPSITAAAYLIIVHIVAFVSNIVVPISLNSGNGNDSMNINPPSDLSRL